MEERLESKMSKNESSAIGIIGGADGPTSVFIAGKIGKNASGKYLNAKKNRKISLKRRIKKNWTNFWYKKCRVKVEKTIVANPHTLDEVIQYMQKKYGAQEISTDSRRYKEERKSLKQSLILKYNPELLKDLPKLEPPKDVDDESIKVYLSKVEEYTKQVSQVPEELFPLDFHIYEMHFEEIGDMHFTIEKNWNVLSGGYSGKKKHMKKLANIDKDIYLFYGVTEEDIKRKSERYSMLVTILAS